LLLFFNQKKTAVKNLRILIEIYSDVTLSIKTYEMNIDSNVMISMLMTKAGKCSKQMLQFASIIGQKSSTIHFRTYQEVKLIVQQLLNVYTVCCLNKSV